MTDESKAYIVIALLAIALAYSLFGGNLPSDRARDSDIAAKFATLERNQRDLTTRLDGIAKDLAASQRRIESIAGRIANAEAGVGEVADRIAAGQKSLTESAGLIESNKRILSAIQSRAEKNPVPAKD